MGVDADGKGADSHRGAEQPEAEAVTPRPGPRGQIRDVDLGQVAEVIRERTETLLHRHEAVRQAMSRLERQLDALAYEEVGRLSGQGVEPRMAFDLLQGRIEWPISLAPLGQADDRDLQLRPR